MKKNIFIIITVFAAIALQGQQITPDVMVSSGGSFTASSGVSLSFSIGECVTETFSASSVTLTQGFQQGYYEVIPLSINRKVQIDMNVYPLPTTDYIIIDLGDYKNRLNAELFDINGRIVMSEEITSESTNLDLVNLVTGTYILVITDSAKNSLRSMQIIKN